MLAGRGHNGGKSQADVCNHWYNSALAASSHQIERTPLESTPVEQPACLLKAHTLKILLSRKSETFVTQPWKAHHLVMVGVSLEGWLILYIYQWKGPTFQKRLTFRKVSQKNLFIVTNIIRLWNSAKGTNANMSPTKSAIFLLSKQGF